MEEVFTRKWFIATIAAWIFILVLDEVAYYWWKSINPGSQFTGILVKHPLSENPNTFGGNQQ